MYGGRYVRLAAGDPGLFSGILKTVAKVAAPITKAVGAVGKIPVLGKVASMLPGVGTVIGGAQLAGAALSAVGGGKGVATLARGIGSAITRGPLKLGSQTLLGPSRPGIGPISAGLGGTAIGAALGAAGGAAVSRRKRRKPAAAASGRRSKRRAGGAVAGRTKRCCAEGERRVCFKKKSRKGSRRGSSLRGAPRDSRGRLLPRR